MATGKDELGISDEVLDKLLAGRDPTTILGAWQSRGLESTYAIVFFDAIRVKIRSEGLVHNRAVYLAIGMRCSGHKEILGIWIEQTEGAKFWLRVMNEIRNRGTQDILIAVVDGLKGFPEAITTVFPKTVVQTCIVHLIRFSMHFASWKERRLVAAALKPVYQAGRWPEWYRSVFGVASAGGSLGSPTDDRPGG